MANLIICLFIALIFPLSFTTISYASSQTNGEDKLPMMQTYIIQVMQPPPYSKFWKPSTQLQTYYESFLPETGNTSAASRIVHQYSNVITGFAANLTEAEVDSIKKKAGFMNVFPDRSIPLRTTHTPTFLGLQGQKGFWEKYSSLGEGVIIGILDTGVDFNHPSFNDHGMEPPPSKWKGRCTFKGCNMKVIGGGDFIFGSPQPSDNHGHGSHTASTAAGNFVSNATMLGNGNGTAAGMAPRAHIAAYKVCGMECKTSAILAGMDAAIKDGVDIMSLSIGDPVSDYTEDEIAIGAFSAMEKGIFVSCAGGNTGPKASSLDHEAPWLLTVGASTMDRSFRVTVKLGDGQQLHGQSLYQPNNFTTDQMIPLVVPPPSRNRNLTNCEDQASVGGKLVKGKIVVCYRLPNDDSFIGIGLFLKKLGAAGMILVNDKLDGFTIQTEAHALPASHISYDDGIKLSNYIREECNPTATFIFEGTVFVENSAPSVASFSGRGPSIASPNLLKPDIIGPGVDVLAAWPIESVEVKGLNFNIISGTSMATPHLSGIAALVKSKHPDWSPAAIKSAWLPPLITLNAELT